MRRGLIGHAALLLVSAALAWWAWTAEETSSSQEGVLLAALEEADLEEVSFRSPKGELTVLPHKEGDEVSWRVTLVHDEEADKPKKDDKAHKKVTDAGPADGGSDAGAPEPEPAPKRVTSRFPGGRQLTRSLDKLTPLRARRSLGKVGDDQLERMGLDQPERLLVVKAKGKTWTFDVGESTYGDQARYALLRDKGEVVLLESAAVRGLEGRVTRLMEARVVTAALDEITAFTVESGGRSAAFIHVEREQPKKRHFTSKADPDVKSDEAQGLIATLRGLRARKYVDERALAAATPVARFKIDRHEKPPLSVALYEQPDGDDYLLHAGPWVGEVPASRGKNLVDDVTAALPVE
jgi:hypothetical protein